MNEDELQQRVIENIKSIRKSKGLSQEKLADKANISRQLMNDIEGKRRWISKKTLVKLCNALNIDAFELFIPNSNESFEMNRTYDAITEKIIKEVKDAVNNALDKI